MATPTKKKPPGGTARARARARNPARSDERAGAATKRGGARATKAATKARGGANGGVAGAAAKPRTKRADPAASKPRNGERARAVAEKSRTSERERTTAGKPRARAKAPSVREKLAVYRSKRDFGITPEPSGDKMSQWKKGRNPFFVIQKHAATRLHYDFRLEVDGVLKSWAVPKGPSMDPADKRLAVETEDHPMDYADFEGIIPEDEYGGGTVIVWDAGPYRNLKRRGGQEVPVSQSYENGQIEIWLEGRKIRGGFALIRSRLGGNDRNWLLVKMRDAAADAGLDPVRRRTESVITGRTIEEVAVDPKKKVWSSRR